MLFLETAKTRTAIFVDVQNIYYTTREAFGRSFDYRKFWQKISATHEILVANAYVIQRNDHSEVRDSQIKFQDALKHIGFDLKFKPYIQRADGSAKGDWDVGITIDVMRTAAEVERVILLSGDGDFDLLMKAIAQDYKVDTWAFGVEKLTARSLMDSVNQFHKIDNHLLIT